MKKILPTLLIFILFINCGFKPIYKLSDENSRSVNYSYEITNQVSREIIEEVNAGIFSNENQKYKAFLLIDEDLTPLIINTNGTVAKYRIEIEISYEVIELDTQNVITEGTTRGNTQYDVVDSEMINEDTKKSMTRIATKNALQIMNSRIQSSISKK